MESASGSIDGRASARWPRWDNYVFVTALEAALTALLLALARVVPVPLCAPYVLLIMAIAFLFGPGPTALAFILGLSAYVAIFTSPANRLWPPANTPERWAELVEFVVFTAGASIAALVMRRSRDRVVRLADELQQSHERYRALVESTADWLWEVDESAVYTYSSPRVREMLGYEPEEVLGKTPFDFMPEDEAERVRAAFEPIAQNRMPLTQLENTLRRKDGRLIVVETSGNPIVDDRGQYHGYRGIDRDITARKRAEEALRESEEKFRSIVETTGEWIWEANRQGRHTYSNPAVEAILGWRADDIVGHDILLFMHKDDRSQVLEVMANSIAKAEGWSGLVIRWRHKDGSYRWLESNSVAVLDDGGEVVGFRGADRDITERKHAEEALQRNLDREHHIAETLQASLLTAVPDRVQCFGFETVYRAASDEARVGGDFYDVFPIGTDRIGIVVGDVSGKGLSAAVQVAMVKYFVRSHAYEHDSPSVVSEHVNKALASDATIEGFATVFFGVLDCSARTLIYSNCGHSPAILWRALEGELVLLDSTSPLLGYEFDAAHEEQTVQLRRGDEIFLGTDGLYEVRCEAGFLEIDGLLQLYTECKRRGEDSATYLVNRVVEFCDQKLRDDVAVLKVSVLE